MDHGKVLNRRTFSHQIAECLREMGHDVVTCTDENLSGHGVPDSLILARAIELNRIVLTYNRRHFFKLHQQTPAHCGIINCSYDPDSARQARRVVEAVTGSQDCRGLLLRVTRPHPSEEHS